jgi:hypothetical protein
MTRRLDGW